jgi:hypothetical protein
MPAIAHSLRVPEEPEAALNQELAHRGQIEWSAGVLAILDEAIRMTRAPGIVFVEGRGGRRAAIAHSGFEVWEIIATWLEGNRRTDRSRSNVDTRTCRTGTPLYTTATSRTRRVIASRESSVITPRYRFYLDEDVPKSAATIGRALGLDIVSADVNFLSDV